MLTQADVAERFSDVMARWQATHGAISVCLVKLVPRVAWAVASGELPLFHAVPIPDSWRLNRKKLLDTAPTDRDLKEFDFDMSVANFGHPSEHLLSYREGQLHADLVLDWLRGTRFIFNQYDIDECSAAWAKIFARTGTECAADMLSRTERVSRTTLLRARTRLDCVAMLLLRTFYLRRRIADLDLYVFVDGSPLWRGSELFAATIDVFYPNYFRRTLLPVVSLAYGHLDVTGKTTALLWQLLLIFGACSLAAICDRVRSVTTDNGVERLLGCRHHLKCNGSCSEVHYGQQRWIYCLW